MLTLDVNQLKQALALAREIHRLEGAKDNADSHELYLEELSIRVAVPAAVVRAEVEKRLAAATQQLTALGIELAPAREQGLRRMVEIAVAHPTLSAQIGPVAAARAGFEKG